MRSILLALVVAATVQFGVAQQAPGFKKPVKPQPVARKDSRPVTCDEARATFIRAQQVLSKSLKRPLISKIITPEGTAPVQRSQVVAEMARLYLASKPSFKFTPPAVVFDASVVSLKDASQLGNLRSLISAGCVAKIGPLATGPKDSLTVEEFGDAVGFFLARIAHITHTPSTRYTPSINGGNPDN